MNKGIEILLERMKSNPEEFVDNHWEGESKWGRIVDSYRVYLPKEDLEIFEKAYKENMSKLMQERFIEDVMKELLDPKSQTQFQYTPYSMQTGKGTQLGGATQGGYTLTTNGGGQWSTSVASSVEDAIKLQTAQMKLQVDAQIQAMKAQQDTEHKTLFGKLFNYL